MYKDLDKTPNKYVVTSDSVTDLTRATKNKESNRCVIALSLLMMLVILLVLALVACCVYFGFEIYMIKSETVSAEQLSILVITLKEF